MANKMKQVSLTLFILVALSGVAQAHVGVGPTTGLMHGFIHPLSGIDHELAMIAVGLFAARLGGKAVWLVPSAFVAMMAVGGALGINGVSVPYVEFGIAASVLVLGAAVRSAAGPGCQQGMDSCESLRLRALSGRPIQGIPCLDVLVPNLAAGQRLSAGE